VAGDTHVLLAKGVHELREDLVGDDSLSEVVAVVGEAAQCQRRGLLDARHLRPRQKHSNQLRRATHTTASLV
jgi:hypothetical protein